MTFDLAKPNLTSTNRPVLQRCSCGASKKRHDGECEECRQKRLQRKPVLHRVSNGETQDIAPPIVHEVLRQPGMPIDLRVREQLQSHLSHDFSLVRVHTDVSAQTSARAVSARAYTVGQHIVFGANQYSPATDTGLALLAHELTHTMQQHEYSGPPNELQIGPANSIEEKQAEAVERTVRSPQSARTHSTKPPTLARKLATPTPTPAPTPIPAPQADASAESKLIELIRKYKELRDSNRLSEQDIKATDAAVRRAEDAIKYSSASIKDTNPVGSESSFAVSAALAIEADAVFEISLGALFPYLALAVAAIAATTVLVQSNASNATMPKSKSELSVADSVAQLQRVVNQHQPAAPPIHEAEPGEVVAISSHPKYAAKSSTKERREKAPKAAPAPIPTKNQKRRKKKCRKEPCPHALPICWPKELPPPGEGELVRTPKQDHIFEGVYRGKPQENLRDEIFAARGRDIPPAPCFPGDLEINDIYRAHHIHPFFLGGREGDHNLCALSVDRHDIGHAKLANQKQFESEYEACGICSYNLYHHPMGQVYYIDENPILCPD